MGSFGATIRLPKSMVKRSGIAWETVRRSFSPATRISFTTTRVWRQLDFPVALTHCFCYRNEVVASPKCYRNLDSSEKLSPRSERVSSAEGLEGEWSAVRSSESVRGPESHGSEPIGDYHSVTFLSEATRPGILIVADHRGSTPSWWPSVSRAAGIRWPS